MQDLLLKVHVAVCDNGLWRTVKRDWESALNAQIFFTR